MEYSEAFDLDRTRLYYKVERLKESTKVLKSPRSMPSDFLILIRNRLRRELFVGTGDGDFHQAEEHEALVALKSIKVDTSLFAFKDESVHRRVHQALSDARVSPVLREVVSDAVMAEGVRLMKDKLEDYRGCPGRFEDTLLVDVFTHQRFVCYEDVGES